MNTKMFKRLAAFVLAAAVTASIAGNHLAIKSSAAAAVYAVMPGYRVYGTNAVITSGQRTEVLYTAPVTANYTFYSSSSDAALDPKAFKGSAGNDYYSDDAMVGDPDYSFDIKLNAGQTFSFYSGVFSGAATGSYKVWVKYSPIKIALGIPSQIPGTVKRVPITFTAPSTGIYVFVSSENGSLNPSAYSRSVATPGTQSIYDHDSAGNNNYRFTKTLGAGETFTFYSYAGSNGGSYNVAVYPEVNLSMHAYSPVSVSSGAIQPVRFTAPASGTYVFESWGNSSYDPKAFVYSSRNTYHDDDGSDEGRHYRFSKTLNAGETFEFYSGMYSSSASGNYNISVTGAPVYPAVSLSMTVNVVAGGMTQVNFTAPSAGTYKFESSNRGSLDPKAFGNLSKSYLDDDSAGNYNYRFTKTLAAGERFAFYSGVYYGTASGSYTLAVTKQ